MVLLAVLFMVLLLVVLLTILPSLTILLNPPPKPQTRDQETAAAVRRLQALPGGLTPHNIQQLPAATLQATLLGVGFYRRKTAYLQDTSKILLEKYGGDIPATVKELCDLPGVGIKMATICMAAAWFGGQGSG
jgi:endonuclease-3